MQTAPPYNLKLFFEQINNTHFDGFLESPKLVWNSRLRSSAGRFVGGSHRHPDLAPPTIEIATYLLDEQAPEALIHSTMSHEIIHYWLWVRKRPYGHSIEFLDKMKSMGALRYNPVPKRRCSPYTYTCAHCSLLFVLTQKRDTLACQICCIKWNDGKYDERFKLNLMKKK